MASDVSQWVVDQLMDFGMDNNSQSGSAESEENKAAVNNAPLGGETASPPCFKPTVVSSVLLAG